MQDGHTTAVGICWQMTDQSSVDFQRAYIRQITADYLAATVRNLLDAGVHPNRNGMQIYGIINRETQSLDWRVTELDHPNG